MKNKPFTLERIYNAPVTRVWQAITDKSQMKQWYFNIAEFAPQVGFEFSFSALGRDGKTEYVHLCRVIEVIPEKKLVYTWRYDGRPGDSVVSFELFEEGDKTRLKLTHTGLESFKDLGPDFAPESFAEGWTHITGISLKEFVENNKTGG